jgi:hypothetical protein
VTLSAAIMIVSAASPALPAGAQEHSWTKRRDYSSPDRQMKAVIVADDPRPGDPAARAGSRSTRPTAVPSTLSIIPWPMARMGTAWSRRIGRRIRKCSFTVWLFRAVISRGIRRPTSIAAKSIRPRESEQTLGKPVLNPDFTITAPATVTIKTWHKTPLATPEEITEDLKLDDLAFHPVNQPILPRTLAMLAL